MKLVVDTNILWSAFSKKSFVKELIFRQDLKLFSPEYALEEINKHKSDILKKAGISDKVFKQYRHDLAVAVIFIPVEEYQKSFDLALKISPDSNDVDFLALALELRLPLWSNDSELKKQNRVKVLSTFDLLSDPDFSEIVFPED